jgi:hypothetical protein
MSENPNAFPMVTSSETLDYPGMTLRDWFAGQALAGILSAERQSKYHNDDLAKASYLVADAMLAERDNDNLGEV